VIDTYSFLQEMFRKGWLLFWQSFRVAIAGRLKDCSCSQWSRLFHENRWLGPGFPSNPLRRRR